MEPEKKNSSFQKILQKLKINLGHKKSLGKSTSTAQIIKDKAPKKHDQSHLGRTPPQLPKNFADDLLNLELEIEEIDPPQISSIKRLLELYIIGVEHYESSHSQRYLIFKNKINVLMSRPKIIEILNRKECLGKIEKSTDSERSFVTLQEKKKHHDLQVFLKTKQGDESIEEKAKTIMDSQENQLKNMSFIIMKEVDNQEKKILDRLEERKRAVSFIVDSAHLMNPEEEEGEEYKKNNLLLLKKGSEKIGEMVNKIHHRSSFRNSNPKAKEVSEKKAQLTKLIEKYDQELSDLRKNLKSQDKSLLIKKMIDKIEKERSRVIEQFEASESNPIPNNH